MIWNFVMKIVYSLLSSISINNLRCRTSRLSLAKTEHLKHVSCTIFEKKTILDGSQGGLKALGNPQRPRQAQPWGVQQVPVMFIKNWHDTSISYLQISALQAIFMACYENIPVKLHPYVLNGMSNRIDINPHRLSNAYGMHCTCMHTCNIFGLEQKAMKTL